MGGVRGTHEGEINEMKWKHIQFYEKSSRKEPLGRPMH